EGQNFTVIVDYAHTPDGLENILRTAREITDGRVLLAFGCGGDRDAKKRPIMGAVAAKLADSIVITSDNPRSENPEEIIREVYAGAQPNASATVTIACETDRATAIYNIIAQAQSGDVVLIAGKGHETYQILNSGTIHFDDREVAREALRGE
ncbi:MAG: cyanophycin synthetase, partial [Negativicoccus succinicivorans]